MRAKALAAVPRAPWPAQHISMVGFVSFMRCGYVSYMGYVSMGYIARVGYTIFYKGWRGNEGDPRVPTLRIHHPRPYGYGRGMKGN